MGERPLPTGIVTFLLTDVVDSTTLWDRASSSMERALTRHDEIIAAAVDANDGVLLKSRGEGDSTFSVFGRASAAVHAACDAQATLSVETWPDGAVLAVRIAVHTGEATERDGDYVGTTVNRAARIRSVCEGGEVLMSAATAELVADHLPVDASLVDLGDVRLRGLSRSAGVFGLVGRGVRSPTKSPRGEAPSSLLDDRGVTRREAEVLDALGDRLTNAEIASRLYLSGRTVESHVSSLLRKLGVTSRLELADIAKQLRAEAPLGMPALPASLELLADRSTYVGRRHERSQLLALWERASSGQALVAVVMGEAGMGKSRLTAEFASEVHARGGHVLLGACFEDVQAPFRPFVQALGDDMAQVSDADLRRRVGAEGDALAHLLPDVAARWGGRTPADVLDPTGERIELFAAVHGYLARAAEKQPTLLVIEDLHWASATTRLAIQHLARFAGRAPLLLVVTTRDSAPDLDDRLAEFLSDLGRSPSVEMVRLAGLEAGDVAELLIGLGSERDPEQATIDAGGNPLFVRELAEGSRQGGSVRTLLSQRGSRLSAADAEIVDVATVIGAAFGADLVAAAMSQDLATVLDGLEAAEDAGLIAAAPGRPGQFAFVHALFRAVRYDALPAGRRMRLHHRVAQALEARSDRDVVVDQLARHACIAAPIGDADAALGYASRAAEAAARGFDHDAAVAHLQRALDVIDLLDPPDEARRQQLTISLGESMMLSGRPDGRTILVDAARAAQRAGDAEAMASAVCALVPIPGGSTTPGDTDPEFVDLADDALELLGPCSSALGVQLRSLLAVQLSGGADQERGLELARTSLAEALALGDPIVIGHSRLGYLTAGWVPEDAADRIDNAKALLEIGRSTGHDGFSMAASFKLATYYCELGDLDEMRRAGPRRSDYTGALSQLYSALRRATDAFLAGDLLLAEERLEEARPLSSLFGLRSASFSGARAVIRAYRGLDAEQIPRLEQASTQTGAGTTYEGALAQTLARHGQPDAAHRLVQTHQAVRFADVPRNQPWAMALALFAEAVAILEDRDAAESLLPLLDPLAGRLAESSSMVTISIDFVRAALTLVVGDVGGAEKMAAAAVDASRRRGTVLFLGRELVLLADCRRRLGAPDDEVDALLAEALAIAERTGAKLIAQDAVRRGLVAAP